MGFLSINNLVDCFKVNPEEDEFEGPLKHRSCTDIICLIIFVAYIIGMVKNFVILAKQSLKVYPIIKFSL
jgi:hypothetical protein